MKTLWKLSLLALLVLAISFTACSKDDDDDNNNLIGPDDITPTNTDWEIIIIHAPNVAKLENYSIMFNWLGSPTALAETDTYYMKIDNSQLPVTSYWMFGTVMLFADAQLNPGHSYNFEFYRNDAKVCDANIRMPYPAAATFPQNYSPTASAAISWSLSDNNQYQYAGVSAYSDDDEYQDAVVPVSTSARSYTVPANAVTGYGPGTEYELLVTQLNFARDGRSAIMAIQGQHKEYNTLKQISTRDMVRQAKLFVRTMGL